MSASYEYYLCDDAGRRIFLMKEFAFAYYSRSTRGYGTLVFGLPLEAFLLQVPVIFQPDWRIDIYRSPAHGVTKRREASYLLRKYHIYDRESDKMRMIEFFGRSPIDLLRRQPVLVNTGTMTGTIDDLMKQLVTDEYLPYYAPTGEFAVEGDVSLGPTETIDPYGKAVLDVITDLKATSFARNNILSTDRRIFFDVVESSGLTNGFGYKFVTRADLFGIDRTTGIVFSPENGNLSKPEYIEDHLDEINDVQVNSDRVTSGDIYLSRWNRCFRYKASVSTDAGANEAEAASILTERKKIEMISANFLSTPGGPDQPRSLYGMDWDLGDLLPVQYAGKNLEAEVEVVWVAVNDRGQENIVGMNRVGETVT